MAPFPCELRLFVPGAQRGGAAFADPSGGGGASQGGDDWEKVAKRRKNELKACQVGI